MEKEKIYEVDMEEIISYSKQKEAPRVTIIEDVNEEEYEYIKLISKRLMLKIVLIKNTNMIAFIENNYAIPKKIAKQLQKRCQIMYYDFIKRPSGSITIYALTGYTDHWEIICDNGYQVYAYDERGEKIDSWINTDIEFKEPIILNSLNLSKFYSYTNLEKMTNREILNHSRINFLANGIYNEERNCYYPVGDEYIATAEKNKLDKLFKKWGFKKLNNN